MATYYLYPSNQAEILSSSYLRDQIHVIPEASEPPFTELLTIDSLQYQFDGRKKEMEFISQTNNSQNSEPNSGGQNITYQEGLSLSLGASIPPSTINSFTYQYQCANQMEYDFEAYNKSSGPFGITYNSRYMKTAQELLDEVVNVQKDKHRKNNKVEPFGSKEAEMNILDTFGSRSKGSSEFSPLEKQQLKDKLANLCLMVDEVDRRYRKYSHQMQIMVSSFETVAGREAASSYTSLARCTISCQFRCLRDLINDQILVIRQSLGEKYDKHSNVEGKLTRLRYVDQQLRQQRGLHHQQQFGVMGRNSWRPQRGLPGNSVSILRAWLFEHFLHPYPKDSEKIVLARQTGLSRGQVANWFINARVRLWKPMVEEMYKEEFGEMNSTSSPDPSPRTPKTNNKPWNSSENIGEEFKESVLITKSEDDSKSSFIPMRGCPARLGFQNEISTYNTTEISMYSVAKQVSLALGLQQGEKDSLLINSCEMQFGGNYEEDYHHYVDPLNPDRINDQNLLQDFAA